MNNQDVIQAAGKAVPPVLYVGLRLGGISLPDWVAIGTLGYILLQSAHLVWKWLRDARGSQTGGSE